MKKIFLIISSIILYASQTMASQTCFIAKENANCLRKKGYCDTQYAPESTFKIPLSLIGFDSGILENNNKPSWALGPDADPYISVCKSNHNPKTWMRDSCLWYSQILTTKLGMQNLQDYITKFSYGNMDLSGGLTKAWISSSLQISPEEQTIFLQKFINYKLPIKNATYDKTKNIIFVQEMPGGWNLYGKTGNGRQLDKDGNATKLQHGWFVGYLEKKDRKIVFASHITDNEEETTFASFRARNEALIQLWHLIEELEQ